MSIFKGDLSAAMPIYVTRKTAGGATGSLSLSIWMQLLAMMLIWFNVVVWAGIGLYVAVRWIV